MFKIFAVVLFFGVCFIDVYCFVVCIFFFFKQKTAYEIGVRLVGSEMCIRDRIIEDSDNIVFFGGAGVSTESGIPDFRSVDGLYNQKYKYPPETIISHSFYRRNPEEFYRFYKDKMIFADAKPNKAHIKLAELEKQGKLKAVITQNIDGLHQMAGSRNVIELHGSVHRNYCEKCHAFYDLDYIVNSDGVPKCEKCGGTVKPDVVLYEEALDEDNMSRALQYISEADTMIIGGTSLVVYPAAGLIRYFRGRKLVVINMSPTQSDSNADLLIADKIGDVPVSYTHLRAHETDSYIVCRLLLDKKKYAVFCLKKKKHNH